MNTFQTDEEKKKRDNVLVFLGGIRVADRIAQALSAESMRALIKFQEGKEYEILGYDNFVTFLNESEHAPMSKNQFYDRKAVLEKEGDAMFNLLNGIGMPVSKRKLLGRGNIQLDGDKIIIVDPLTHEEISFDAGDKSRILETISALADANADKSKKLDRGAADNERLKRKLNDLEETIESERLAPSADLDEIENCYMVVGSTMQRLNTLLADAAIVRVARFEDKNLRVLAAQYQRLNEIIHAKLPSERAAINDDEEDRLASLLDDED